MLYHSRLLSGGFTNEMFLAKSCGQTMSNDRNMLCGWR